MASRLTKKLSKARKKTSSKSLGSPGTPEASLDPISEDQVTNSSGLRSKVKRLVSRPSADHSLKSAVAKKSEPRGEKLPVFRSLATFPPQHSSSDQPTSFSHLRAAFCICSYQSLKQLVSFFTSFL